MSAGALSPIGEPLAMFPPKVAAMRDEVEAFASAFEMPAFTKESIDI